MITVRQFRDGDEDAFAALNLRWIEQFFVVEDSDRAQLENPQDNILASGGTIAIAESDGVVVGTAGLVPPHWTPDDGRRWLELVKMATDPAAQGQGVASKVIDFLISEAEQAGIDAIWLETNSSLAAAVRLYERHGFRRLDQDALWPTPYARCNLQMVREL